MTAGMWALTVVGILVALSGFGLAGFGVYRIRKPFIPDGPMSKDDERPAVKVRAPLAIEAAPR